MAGVAVLPTIASSHEAPSIAAEAGPAAPSKVSPPSTVAEGGAADIAYLDTPLRAPFDAIQRLFDHLRADPAAAAALNATYPSRGVFKTAAVRDAAADQKLRSVPAAPVPRRPGAPRAARAPRLRGRARILRGPHHAARGCFAGGPER